MISVRSLSLSTRRFINKTRLQTTRVMSEMVDYRFLVNRGDCLRAQHKYGLALIDYDAAMASLKIRKLGASSGVEGARRQWNVATRLSLTHYLVACDYFNENAYEDAERQLCLAVDYNPKVSEYYHARGRARYYVGRHQDAYEDFKATYALDPGNSDVLLRLKQFEANHPGVVVSTTVEAAGVEGLGKTKKPVEEGMTIDEARNSAAPPIPVTDADTLTALLHATNARSLPEVAAQLRAQKAIRAAITVRTLEGESGAPEDRLYGHEVLPRLNPGMTIAAVTAMDRDVKSEFVTSIMKAKPDTEKAVTWTALTNAKKSAQLVSRPAPGSRAAQEAASKDRDDDLESVVSRGGTVRKVQKSYTVSGLKRFSQKQTAKALREGGLVKGVLTHSGDPFVRAYEAEQAARGMGPDGKCNASGGKAAITINVTARSRTNKWSKNASKSQEGDDGGVETFESYNRMNELVSETESGNWRVKLREAQEAKERHLTKMRMAASASNYRSSGLTEAEVREEERRLAQKQSEMSITLSDEQKAALKEAAKEKKRKRRKKRRDPNAPRTVDFAVDSTTDTVDGEGHGDADESEQEARDRAHLTADRNESSIAALLAQAGVEEANWGTLLGDGDDVGGIMLNEENESSLIAMTEEEELQLAYEQRIKAEHEEQRKKRQERREQIMKKNSLHFLEDPKVED